MCRLSAFFGAPICAADLVTRPCRSIITQSFDARERMTGDASTPGYLNGDGFGLGWYSDNPADTTPCVYRQARPAWNDPNLGPIAEKVYTPVLFAHVRAASPGLDVSETTCHPFRWGRYLWMHNGGLGNFAKTRRKLLGTLSEDAFDFAVSNGSSDTALCFAVFLNLIEDRMAKGTPEKLRQCLEQTIMILDKTLRDVGATETSLLNFVVSDGDSLVASRYVINLQNDKAKAASLYYASGNSYQSDGTAPGNYEMKHTDRRPSLAIISSEPLTECRADWVTVPRNSSIVITKSIHILISPINNHPDPHISRILLNLSESQCSDRKNGSRAQTSRMKKVTSKKDERGSDIPSNSGSLYSIRSTVRSTITIPGRTVLCCAVMEPLLCSGMDDGTIHVWNMEDSILAEVLRTGKNPVLAMLAVSEAGILISATSASTVTVYRMSPEKRFEASFVVCCEGKGDILSLTKIGRKVFAGSSDAKVRCVIEDVFASDGPMPTEGVASDESCSDGSSSLADIKTVYSAKNFPSSFPVATHYGYVFAVTSCVQGRFLCTGSGDGLLRVWNVASEKCVQKRDDHAGAILALVTYEMLYGTMLFSGSGDCSVKVWVWDGDNGFICKRTLRKHKDEVVFLTLFGDKLVSGSADGTICVWCAESLALICQYRDNTLKAGAVSLHYNLLFTASDEGAIYIRDILLTERDLDRRDPLSRNMSGVPRMIEGRKVGPTVRKRDEDTAENDGEHDTGHSENDTHSTRHHANAANPVDCIVSEVHEDADEAETLVPGVTNEMVLAPPMSPRTGCAKTRTQLLSTLLTEKEGATGSELSLIDSIGKLPRTGHAWDGEGTASKFSTQAIERRLMQNALARFLSFPTVSGAEEHGEGCWQGARYIGTFLEGLGASVKYVSTAATKSSQRERERNDNHPSSQTSKQQAVSGSNPIVLARFASANPCAKTLTFYGHYDVMPVDSHWKTDPWSLTSIDGYFYGRGATDNKGPIIAMIFAIKKLLEDSAEGLNCNLVLILQGEGETSNAGFKDCVNSHLHWFESTSLILTSNSYWLGEEKPCITYSFRGLIELQVSVTGGSRNLHSGVDGGAIFEPMNDLISILGTLVDASGVVCVPGFYDDVRPLTSAEKKLLKDVDFNVEEYRNRTGVQRFTSENGTELLESRWRKPSVSITSVETTNVSGFYSVVPRRAQAKMSIRFVPDQDPSKIEKAVATHLEFELRKRRSPNTLEVHYVNKGDWWLGDPSCPQFQIAECAVRSVWGVTPEYVCEGGSMPLFSFLVKSLEAPLVQVPLGQSSDGAHLPNERIRSINLFRGKEVLQRIIQKFAESDV